MKTLEIINEAGFLIPLKELDKERVERAQANHLIRIYQENQCKKCPYLEDRHSENCQNCQAFLGARQTCKKVVYKGEDYLSIPRGRRDYIEKLVQVLPHDEVRIKSGFKNLPMSRPIRLLKTTKLRDYQVEAVETAFKKKRGIIMSPPRSGKTLMGAALIAKIGQKALIIAHQREWLIQFQETFLGSPTQDGFTNARPSQIGFARKLEDFDKYDVCLCTFSQFFSEKGKSILQSIRDKFAIVLIDEVHGTPALATSRCLSQFAAKWVIGLSGTPERKVAVEMDVAFHLVGPVIYKSNIAKVRPRVELLHTPGEFQIDNRAGKGALTSLQNKLETNKPRRRVIIDHAIRMAKRGHLVMIPLTRVRSILEWTRIINEKMESPAFAVPFYGGIAKDTRVKIMERLRRFKSRIVIGNISMLSVGLNIPRASYLMEVGVTSNLPKAQQRFARVLTPMEDKPDPVICFTLDNCDFMRKCRRNEYYNALIKHFNPIVKPEDSRALADWFAGNGKDSTPFWKDV